jgi:hypothetical protein
MSKNTSLTEKVEKRLKEIKFKTPHQAQNPKILEKNIKDVLKEEKSLLRYLISLRELLKDFCIMSAIIKYYFD